MANPLSTSQQISEEYGIHPRKKRPRTNNDLFDILDGGNGQTQVRDGDEMEGMYDASLPDDLPTMNPSIFPPSSGLSQSMDFASNAFLNNDAMDTDPLKMSGGFLGSTSTFSAPTATLFDARVKFDPGISMGVQQSFFVAQSTAMAGGRTIFANGVDPATQALQLLQTSVLDQMHSPDSSAMDTTPISPSSSHLGNTSQYHLSVIAVMPPDSLVPQDRNLLAEPKRLILELRTSLDSLKQMQKDCLCRLPRPDPAGLQQVATFQKDIGNKLESLRQQLENLRAHVLLLPVELSLLNQLRLELSLQTKQLQLYQIELEGYIHPKGAHSFAVPAALVITQQPFPKSVKQNKPVDDGVYLRLLTGAACAIWPVEPVTAFVVADVPPIATATSSGRTKKSASATASSEQHTVLNNQKMMDNGTAIFDQLTFPQGSRKRTLNLKFVVTVNCSRPLGNNTENYTCQVESEISQPFIVKTNENQWEEAEGSLLKAEAFGTRTDISWYQLCNSLQRRYLMATKQDALHPQRALSSQDFNYLYSVKFSNQGSNVLPNEHTMISAKAYDEFWLWFGPGLHKIRYQRHLCTLWQQGFLCGFLQRDEAVKALAGAPFGSFLVRLSERAKGGFAIAYVAVDKDQLAVCHYLITQDDVFGPKKTLPDFLSTRKSLLYLTQVLTDPETGNRIYRLCDKDIVLQEYYSKKTNDVSKGPNPYDEVIRS